MYDIYTGDCIEGMRRSVEPGSVRLAIADPPYNLGIDYGTGARADRLPAAKYLAWCEAWMEQSVKSLTEDGSLWVLINDEWADHFGLLLKRVGLRRKQWLIWYETFGVNVARGFNRCSRHLFWMVKSRSRFVFNRHAVHRPSARQTVYQDKRASPAGKTWDSV